MKLTKEQLDQMVMRDGRVLVKVDVFEATQIGSIHVHAVADETRAHLVARSGVVIKVPEKTLLKQGNYDFISEMEIEVGDKAWWSGNVAGNLLLLNENAHYFVDGVEYLVIPYSEIYLVQRGEQMLAMNDRIIAKRPEVQQIQSSILDLSACSLSEPPPDRFVVVYVPSFHGSYASGRQIIRCEVGDTVKVDSNGGVAGKLEEEYRNELGDLYYFRSADVLAKQDRNEETN